VQTRIVHCFVMFSATLLLILPHSTRAEQVKLTRQGDTIQVAIGGSPFTTFHFEPEYSKSFLQPLRDAKGIVVTRGIPVGNEIPPDHVHDKGLEPHQRAMYFAHGDIDGYSFWIEEVFKKFYGQNEPKYGRMVFRKIDEMRSGASSGTIRATFDLEGDDKQPFAQETQEYKFSGDKESRIIDCEFVIKAGKDAVHFGDTKEGTFAIRLAPELDAPTGMMVNSEGGQGESQVWGKRADWVDVDGVIDGQKLGVAVFDAPDSFRHPTYWHARGYGLLAANPFGLQYFLADQKTDEKKDGSYTLPAGQSVKFHYRVVIHDGSYKDAGIADRWSSYAAQQ
jgi:hypothetical protein